MADERKKRVILTNPDEPRAGDFAYGFYDKTHPLYGDPETIARMRKSLRGLRGEEVTMTFKGERTDPDTGKHYRFTVKRTFKMNTYRDVFGPGSAYASAIHWVRDKHSSDELAVLRVEIEEANIYDEDSESEQ